MNDLAIFIASILGTFGGLSCAQLAQAEIKLRGRVVSPELKKWELINVAIIPCHVAGFFFIPWYWVIVGWFAPSLLYGFIVPPYRLWVAVLPLGLLSILTYLVCYIFV